MFFSASLGRHSKRDARGGQRYSVFLPAKMICAGKTEQVHLLDLSKNGALAHAQEPRRPNEAVWLVSQGIDIAAYVAWTRGNRFGLAFSTPLTDERLNALVRPL